MTKKKPSSTVALVATLLMGLGVPPGCDQEGAFDSSRAEDSDDTSGRGGRELGLQSRASQANGDFTVGSLPGGAGVGRTGSANYSIPLELPKGVGGFAPRAAINYSSGGGDGLMGPGFALGGLSSSITRCPRSWLDDGKGEPVLFGDSDALCLDGGRLALHSGEAFSVGAVYRQLAEGFQRVEVIGLDEPDPAFPDAIAFKVTDRDGVQHFYGNAWGTRMRHGADDYAWVRTRTVDTFGNEIRFEYDADQATVDDVVDTTDLRLATVTYAEGGDEPHQIELYYENREFAARSFFYGAYQRSPKRLQQILTRTSGSVLREYTFTYEPSSATDRELLRQIDSCAHHPDGDVLCVPPTVFDWEETGPFETALPPYPAPGVIDEYSDDDWIPQHKDAGFFVIADTNGDGDQEMVFRDKESHRWMNWSIDEDEGGVAITEFVAPLVHQSKVLRPIAVELDDDPSSEVLLPQCELEPGEDDQPECRFEAYSYHDEATSTAIPYTTSLAVLDEPSDEGAFLVRNVVSIEGAAPARIYMIPPSADVDGDGRNDLFVCGSQSEYSDATWRLLHNTGGWGSGEPAEFYAYELNVPCDLYDRWEGPTDINGDGRADLLLATHPDNPLYNSGDLFERLAIPTEHLGNGNASFQTNAGEYGDWFEPTGLPTDDIASLLADGCAWASPYLIPDDVEAVVEAYHYSKYFASLRGQGTHKWADFNGDGSVDVLRLDISTNFQQVPEAGQAEDLGYLATLCEAGELPPVGTPAPKLKIWANRGGTFAPDTVVHEYTSTTVVEMAKDIGLLSVSTYLFDFNRDGITDIEFDTGDADGEDCTRRRHYARADFTTDEVWSNSYPNCPVESTMYEGSPTLERPFRTAFRAQVRGGRAALVTLRETPPGVGGAGENWVPPTIYSADIFQNRPTDRIVAVTDGLGARVEYEYAASSAYTDTVDGVYEALGACDADHRCLVGSGGALVKEIRRDAGMLDGDEMHTTSFIYSDGRFGRSGRGFLGFETVQSVTYEDDGTGDALPIGRSRAHYDFSFSDEFRGFPFAGAPDVTLSEVIVEDATGSLRREVTRTTVHRETKPSPGAAGNFVATDWTAVDRLHIPVSLCGSVDSQCTFADIDAVMNAGGDTADSGVDKQTVVSTFDTDAYGTVTFRTRQLNGAGSETTYGDFIYDDVLWILGLPRRITQTSKVGGAELTRESELSYDMATRAVEQVLQEPGASEYELRTEFTRDTFGNVTRVFAANSEGEKRYSSFQFDGTAGVALEKVGNALDQWSGVVEAPGTGLVLTADEPNGTYVENAYDAFGRLTQTRRYASYPGAITDGNDLTIARVWDDTVGNSVFRVDTSVLSGGESRSYFDRLGREIRSCWLGMGPAGGGSILETPGVWICQDTDYDIRGNISRVSVPFYEGSVPVAHSHFVHDNAGRVLESESPEGRQRFYEYGFYEQAIEDADGNRKTTRFDNTGRLWYTVDAHNTVTCYEFGPFDLVERVSRNCFNPTGDGGPGGPEVADLEFKHDLYGNVVWSYDPDRGAKETTYKPGFFDIDTATDGNGEATSYDYDALGRVDHIQLPDGPVSIAWDVGKIGLVHQVSGPDFTHEIYSYDEFLRTDSIETIVLGDSYTVDLDYSGGRLDSIGYPGGVSVDYFYDGAGYIREAYVDGDLAWRAEVASLLGMVERSTFGNSAQTTKRYDWDGFLTQSTTTTAAATDDVEAMDYVWNHLGELDSRTDLLTDQTQEFSYDGLSRLLKTTTYAAGKVVDSESYAYDKLGNITEKAGVGTYKYDYGFAGNRVDSIDDVNYQWDYAGQLERRADEEFTWTGRGKLATYLSATEEQSHIYDGSGSRVRTIDKLRETETTFVGGLYQETVEPDQVVDRFTVVAGGQAVAQLTRVTPDGKPPTETIEYLHPDHLGSPSLTTNGDGLPEREIMFDPWGAIRERGDWTQAPKEPNASFVNTDYTGHEERLGNDLVNMNARYFDTRIGRSISADTIIPNPLDSQSYNRFAYVQNNPLGFTDPTGNNGQSVGGQPGTVTDVEGRGAWGDHLQDDASWIRHVRVPAQPDPWNPHASLTSSVSAQDQLSMYWGYDMPSNHRPGPLTGPGYFPIHDPKTKVNSDFSSTAPRHLIENNATRPSTRQRPQTDWITQALDEYESWPDLPIDCTGLCAEISKGVAATDRQGETDRAEMARVGNAVRDGMENSPGAASAYLTAFILEEAAGGLVFQLAGAALRSRRAARLAQGKQCFSAGTLVETEDGLVPIEEIGVGDLVWSRNDDTGEEGWKSVAQTFSTPEQALLEVILEGGAVPGEVFEVTGGHPFWSLDDGGWEEARDLQPGELLDTLSGPMVVLDVVALPERELVYNFEVEGSHTYFVGESGAWVHNSCLDEAEEIAEGIYEFVATSGKRYVGQSGKISKRMRQHIRDGRLSPDAAVSRTHVPGGKTAREIAEQQRIDQLGGVEQLENVRNAVGAKRREKLMGGL